MDTDEEFSAFVAARWGRLVRSAVLLGCSGPEAEDIVQSALIRCLLHWSKVRGADDIDAYVHRVLINAFTASRRRRWSRERAVPAVPEPSAHDESRDVDRIDAVVRSLRVLTDDQRTAVVLRYYANLDERQMASALGVPQGTVKSRLSRALKILSDDPHLAELRGTP